MIGFEPFKGRTAVLGAPTSVHRNLNRRDGVWWSVTQAGLVVGHARSVVLADASAHVNERAQAKIAAGASRSVHAWIKGLLVLDTVPWPLDHLIHYRPHVSPFFHDEHGAIYRCSDVVVFDQEGMWA
jgi:hypothetical protein